MFKSSVCLFPVLLPSPHLWCNQKMNNWWKKAVSTVQRWDQKANWPPTALSPDPIFYIQLPRGGTHMHTTCTQWPLKESKVVRINQWWSVIMGVPSQYVSEMIKLYFNWPVLDTFSLFFSPLFILIWLKQLSKSFNVPCKAQKPLPNAQRCNKQTVEQHEQIYLWLWQHVFWQHRLKQQPYVFQKHWGQNNMMGTFLLISLSRIVYFTGLLSSLGVRGSCWLVSVASDSCSDTATNHKNN